MRHFCTLLLCLALAACAGAPSRAPTPTPTLTDSAGIAFALVPAGEFMMGSDEDPKTLAKAFPAYDAVRLAGLADEAPVHKVRITRAFWMGRHEITVAQFRRFLEGSGHVAESEADGTGGFGFNSAYDPAASANGDAFEGRNPKYSWRNPGFSQGDDHPVVNVSWNDAVAMARWLGAKEGTVYRLPTEAEWEYAARAGTRTRFNTGDAPQTLAGSANLFDPDAAVNWPRWKTFATADSDGHAFTAPAGTFSPNAFGLHDMHGNVWEWTADWYAEDYYATSPVDDPQGPPDGDVRVRRGGSWHTWPFYARSSFRNWNTPQSRYPLQGFRLVREVAR